MFKISEKLSLSDEEVRLSAVRAQGAGGQNVNKVSSAVHLRFDIPASSLPEACKQRLLALPDRRVNDLGILVIKAQRFRTREQNTADAMARLRVLIRQALVEPRNRIATGPTRSSGERRLEGKIRRGRLKLLRSGVSDS
jgi:ribosome-associated protein